MELVIGCEWKPFAKLRRSNIVCIRNRLSSDANARREFGFPSRNSPTINPPLVAASATAAAVAQLAERRFRKA